MSRPSDRALTRWCRTGRCGCDHDTRTGCPLRPVDGDRCLCSDCPSHREGREIREIAATCSACAGADTGCEECAGSGRAVMVPGYAADGTPTGTWVEVPAWRRPFRHLVVTIIHTHGLDPWVGSWTVHEGGRALETRIPGGRTWPRLSAELRRLADVLGQRWAPRGDR